MTDYQDLLDESFVDKLNFEPIYQDLPVPEMEGFENILRFSSQVVLI